MDYKVTLKHRDDIVQVLHFGSATDAKRVANNMATGRLVATVMDASKRTIYTARGYWK